MVALRLRFGGSRVLRPFAGKLAVGVLLALTLSAAAAAGYQQLFHSWALYDDEGYLLLSLRLYLSGQPLYDAVFTQYGPAYYAVHGWFHRIAGTPITHDVARFKTLVVWLAAAGMCAVFVHRLTELKTLALFTFLSSFFHLDRLGLEPAHPQDVCVLALVGSLLAATFIRRARFVVPNGSSRSSCPFRFVTLVWHWPCQGWHWLRQCFDARPLPRSKTGTASATQPLRSSRFRAVRLDLLATVALAALTALASLTKVNFGGALFLAVGLALLLATRPSRAVRYGCVLVAVGAMALPWLIARDHSLGFRGHRLPVVMAISVAVSAWVAWHVPRRRTVRPELLVWFGALCGVGCVLLASLAISHGTSWHGLAHGLVGQHLGFVDVFYEDPPLYAVSGAAAILAATAALTVLRGCGSVARLLRLATVVIAVGVALRQLADSFSPLDHGADDRGQAALMISFVTPLLWLVLLPYWEPEHGRARWLADGRFARMLLCTAGAILPVIVYPIPGTQTAIGSLCLLLAVIVCVGDCLRMPQLLGEREGSFRRVLLASLVVLSLLTLACRDVCSWQRRSAGIPLGLPGAARLRLPPEWVDRQQWTVAQLRQHADRFVCLQNGHNSLYLWSQIDPPTGWNTTLWQDLLSDDQQHEVIQALELAPRSCVVVDRAEPLPKRGDGPLTVYLKRRFAPLCAYGSTEIWIRRP